jgi:hypothetical protein
MISRRIALAFAAVAAAWLLSSTAHAQQAFERFTAFLVDLQGWQGAKPDGMALDMPGNSMITATRDYKRGSAQLTAQIMIGPVAQAALAPTAQDMKFETKDARIVAGAVDGFRVTQTFNFADKSGAIIVALGTAAMLNLTFNGVADDEALAIAKRFNWKAIQAALPK